jgi:hypothetical protein
MESKRQGGAGIRFCDGVAGYGGLWGHGAELECRIEEISGWRRGWAQ